MNRLQDFKETFESKTRSFVYQYRIQMPIPDLKKLLKSLKMTMIQYVDCSEKAGTSIPPLIIFRGKSMQHQYFPSNRPTDWSLRYNTKGWTSNEHGIEWLRQCFEPQTREKANGAPRLLICDGHDGHITGNLSRRVRIFLEPWTMVLFDFFRSVGSM